MPKVTPHTSDFQTYSFVSSQNPRCPRKGLFPHFINEETEGQRTEMRLRGSHSDGRTEAEAGLARDRIEQRPVIRMQRKNHITVQTGPNILPSP